jgi:hypothetical protein
MKKPIILVVVVLAAALAALKYFSSRNQAPAAPPAQATAQQVPEGVALPEGAQDFTAPPASEYVYVPSPNQGTYGSLTLPPAAMSLKGACEGGSIKEIVESHGKTWGYFTGRRAAFTPKKSQEIYTKIGDYYACLSAARHDITICGELPGDAEQDGITVTLGDSPLGQCIDKAGIFLFKGYVAGRVKERSNCIGFITSWESRDMARVSPPDFCAAAAQGPDKLAAYARDRFGDMWGAAEKMMGFSRKTCGSDAACLANNDLWEGIKSGRADKCPPAYAPHCAALIQKTQVPCAAILNDLSKTYCAYYKDLFKQGGGYPGYTPEEVAEALRLKAEKKAEEERQRRENETVTKDINTRVKKLTGVKTD